MPSDHRPTIPASAFLDELRLLAGLKSGPSTDRVLEAFGTVPRATFAGPGPWTVRSALYGMDPQQTPDDDPRWLDHCVLVALDEEKGINIGEPSMWARLLSRTEVPPGARILQVGAGVGYYTAILAQLAGPDGAVLGFEVEGELARCARDTVGNDDRIEIRHGNAATDLRDEDGPFDLVVAFAGVTHPVPAWTDRLAPKGRLLLPVTGTRGFGAMMLMEPTATGFDVLTLGQCGFYACAGARDDATARRLDKVFVDRTRLDGWRLTIREEKGQFRYDVDGQTF